MKTINIDEVEYVEKTEGIKMFLDIVDKLDKKAKSFYESDEYKKYKDKQVFGETIENVDTKINNTSFNSLDECQKKHYLKTHI
jgi:hypothetical protein